MTGRWFRKSALAAIALSAAMGWAAAPQARAASRTDLDANWQFRADPQESGLTSGWTQAIPTGTQSVTVPHTWNVGSLHDYRGVAWYFRRFELAPGAGHVELHFGATFYSARVWLNGQELGSHEGGFTAYSFDITRRLRGTNVLVVRLDNRPGMATIPGIAARGGPDARYDWWTYGGLVRDVWLTTSGPVWIRRQNIRTEQSAGAAVIHDRIFLGSSLPPKTPVTVRVTALDADGSVAATGTQVLPLAHDNSEVPFSLDVRQPGLWSIDRPNLYRLVVEVEDGHHRILDRNSATFGIRTLEIRDRHLLINGERVRLTGIARHEDSPWEGLAETAGTMRHDWDDMRSLHTTLTRPVHYPQNPFILDYADRYGILLIPEIPVWQFSEAQLSDPRVVQLAQQQMREMIEEAGNHPSIFGWSVANESATGTPGGIAYFRALRDMIHRLDPGRPVTFADDNLPKLTRADQSAANDADFLMMNQYFGSWHGPAQALVPALDQVNRLFPDKMVIISEMGFAGIFAHNAAEADEARIRIMREQMPVLAGRDWIAGAILWCYQDYKSPRNLWPGESEGFVEHGLVDEARQRKPSYAVWKELNSPVSIQARWTGPAGTAPSGFQVSLATRTVRDLPFYPLHDAHLSWLLADSKGRTVVSGARPLADSAAPTPVSVSIPQAPAGGSEPPPEQGRPDSQFQGLVYRLTVSLQTADGQSAQSETLEWPAQQASAQK